MVLTIHYLYMCVKSDIRLYMAVTCCYVLHTTIFLFFRLFSLLPVPVRWSTGAIFPYISLSGRRAHQNPNWYAELGVGPSTPLLLFYKFLTYFWGVPPPLFFILFLEMPYPFPYSSSYFFTNFYPIFRPFPSSCRL